MSSSHKAVGREFESELLPSQNPILDQQPPTVSSLTHSIHGSHCSRKTQNPKRFVVATSPSASPQKIAEDETVDGDEGQEVSSQKVGKSSETQQDVVSSGEGPAVPAPSFDLNIATHTGNVLPTSSDSILAVNEKEAIENILLIVAEGGLVGGYKGDNETIGSQREDESQKAKGRELVRLENLAPFSTTGEKTKGHDPFAQEEHFAPTWDETHCSSKEPQVSTDPASSPHFDAKPLNFIILEMRSLSEDENKNIEEDYDNVIVASFIAAKSGMVVPKEPTLKRPTTRLQKKEAFEYVLKNNKEEKKRRRLVKGEDRNEDEVPLALAIDVNNEVVNEEPASLIHKSSKKPMIPKLGDSHL